MLFQNLSREIFKTLKGYGARLSLYGEDGARTYDPRLARRMFDSVGKSMVVITPDGSNSSIGLYLSHTADLEKMGEMISTLRSIATRYNVLFNVRNYGKELTPRDFATQTRDTMKEDWNTEIHSTGEWADYTIAELLDKRKALMAKEKRTKDEQTMVRQIDFAIRAKRGFEGGVKEGRIAELEQYLRETKSGEMTDTIREDRRRVLEEIRALKELDDKGDRFVSFASKFFTSRPEATAGDISSLASSLKAVFAGQFPGKGSLTVSAAKYRDETAKMIHLLSAWQKSGISSGLFLYVTHLVDELSSGKKLGKNDALFAQKMADMVKVDATESIVREYDEVGKPTDAVRAYAERYLSDRDEATDRDVEALTRDLKMIGTGRFPGRGKLGEIPDVRYRDEAAKMRHQLSVWQEPAGKISDILFLYVTDLSSRLANGERLSKKDMFFVKKMADMVGVRTTVEERELDRFFSDFEPDDFLTVPDRELKEFREELPGDVNPDVASYVFALSDQGWEIPEITAAVKKEFGPKGNIAIADLLKNEAAYAWWKRYGKRFPVVHTHMGDSPLPVSMMEDEKILEAATMDDVHAMMNRVSVLHGKDEAARQAAEFYWQDLGFDDEEAAYRSFRDELGESLDGDVEADFRREVTYNPADPVEPSTQDAEAFYESDEDPSLHDDISELRRRAGMGK